MTDITVDILGHSAFPDAKKGKQDKSKAIVLFITHQEHKRVVDISKSFCHLLLISEHGSIASEKNEILDRDRWDLHLASKNCEMTTESYFLFYECVKKYMPKDAFISLAIHDTDAVFVAFEWLRHLVSIAAFDKVPNIKVYPSDSFVLTPPTWIFAVSNINDNYRYQEQENSPGKDKTLDTLDEKNRSKDLLGTIRESCESYAHIYHPFNAEFARLQGAHDTTKDRSGPFQIKLDVIRAISKVNFPKISGIVNSKYFNGEQKLFEYIDDKLIKESTIGGRLLNLYGKEDSQSNESNESNESSVGEESVDERESFLRKITRFKEQHIHSRDLQEFTDFTAFLQLLMSFDGKYESSAVLPFFNFMDQSDRHRTENVIESVAKIQDNLHRQEYLKLLKDTVECIRKYPLNNSNEGIEPSLCKIHIKLADIRIAKNDLVSEWKQLQEDLPHRIDQQLSELYCVLLKGLEYDDSEDQRGLISYLKSICKREGVNVNKGSVVEGNYSVRQLADKYYDALREWSDLKNERSKSEKKYKETQKKISELNNEIEKLKELNKEEINKNDEDSGKSETYLSNLKKIEKLRATLGRKVEDQGDIKRKRDQLDDSLKKKNTYIKEQMEYGVSYIKGANTEVKVESYSASVDPMVKQIISRNIPRKEIGPIRTNKIDETYIHNKVRIKLSDLERLCREFVSLEEDYSALLKYLQLVNGKLQEFYLNLNSAVAHGRLMAIDEMAKTREINGEKITNIFLEWVRILKMVTTHHHHKLLHVLENEVCSQEKTEYALGERQVSDLLFSHCRSYELKGAGQNRMIRDIYIDILALCLHSANYNYSPDIHGWLIEYANEIPDSSYELVKCAVRIVDDEFKACNGDTNQRIKVVERLFDRVIIRLSRDDIYKLVEFVNGADDKQQQSIDTVDIKGALDRLLKKSELGKLANTYSEELHAGNIEQFLYGDEDGDKRRVFICYTRSDGTDVVDLLRNEFEQDKDEFTVYTDTRIQSGHLWLPVISHMIDLADVIVVVVSDDALTNQVYSTGFIRNYEARRIQNNTDGKRPGGRPSTTVRFVDVTDKYQDSSLVSHVYGNHLRRRYELTQRAGLNSDGRYFSESEIEDLLKKNN